MDGPSRSSSLPSRAGGGGSARTRSTARFELSGWLAGFFSARVRTRRGLRRTLRRFLRLVLEASGSASSAEIEDLRALLDRLAVLATSVQARPVSAAEAQLPSPAFVRARVAERFPRLGLYTAPNHEVGHDVGQEPLIGDAVDDLADIARDLAGVEDLFRRGHPDDAVWTFTFLYRIHWGEHLRCLAWFLHGLEDEDEGEDESEG